MTKAEQARNLRFKKGIAEGFKALIAMRPEHISLFSPDEEVVRIVRSYLNEREQLRVRNTGKKEEIRNETHIGAVR